MHFLIYKILFVIPFTNLLNIYDFADFWGTDHLKSNSLISIFFFIHILLIGYLFSEAWADWFLFSRFRNLSIYGITFILAVQSIIGLDLIRRYSPYNPDQMNRIYILQDAILKNNLDEVKRLIAIGYKPFDFSHGSRNLLDDYKWFIFAYWPTPEDFDKREGEHFFYGDNPSLFYFASVSGIKGVFRWNARRLRNDIRHPKKPDVFPAFDDHIFNYLLSLNPPKKQLQLALYDIASQGNTTALNKLLDYDKSLTPTLRDINLPIMLCYADVSEILLKRYFENAQDKTTALHNLYEEFGYEIYRYNPCTAPIRKYFETKKYPLP